MGKQLRVVVIGAGLGGLSAAAHLSKAGHDVTIVEREAIPGGRAGMIRSHGFSLDNGPTVLTMPDLLEEAFIAAGANMADHVTIKPVDPMYRACYADGSTLFVRHGREAMTEEIRRFANAKEAEAFGRFSDWLEQLYNAEMRSYIDTNINSPLDLIKPWRDGLAILKMGGFGKLDKKVASFFDDQRLQQIFSFQSMYAGLAPYEALAIYAVITYMDSVQGVFVPEGGMHQMAAGLAEAVEQAGVTIRYSSPVSHIVRHSNGTIRGVRLGTGEGSELVEADAVVCNPDLPVAYRELLGDVEAPKKARNGKYSPSCLLWIAGVNGLPPDDASPPQHPLRAGLGRVLQSANRRRCADARPVDPRHAPQPRRRVTRPRRLLEHLRARAHPEPERQDRLVSRARPDHGVAAQEGHLTRLPNRGGRGRDLRPAGLGANGNGTGHTVRSRPYVLPNRPVPAEQRRQASAGPRVHGFVHAARCRCSDGARLGQTRRRTRRRVRRPLTATSHQNSDIAVR